MTERPSGPPTTTPAGGSGVPASAMVVERSGGIAGFHDVADIAADGSAQVTSRNGVTRSCTPDPVTLDRLREFDLAAVGSGPPKVPIADGFTYVVRTERGSASAGDGDTGIRAAFAAAAAAVISSCLANVSSSGLPEM